MAEIFADFPAEIPGLIEFTLPVHADPRGWFKENYQRTKMVELGLPADFAPVQNNISFNESRGVTRGLHAEPWDKFISVATGEVFAAWVDLREGDNFGAVYTTTITPGKAIFLPRGVANAFQTLTDNTAYTYLVNAHWSESAQYKFVNLADKSLKIKWPIPLGRAVISDKDLARPALKDVAPMSAKKFLVTGAGGQLGTALRAHFPTADFFDETQLDITNAAGLDKIDWSNYAGIINAAAYTNVDASEYGDGRKCAWRVNVDGVRNLAQVAARENLTLVHVSSDYVFDGLEQIHDELEQFAPLSVYGQTKAAGDAIVSILPKHFIVRTSWVVGEGKNFVTTMLRLAKNSATPKVVFDQIGRLTFADDLARGIKHLLDARANYGTYNLTGSGDSASWAEIAKEIFQLAGREMSAVSPVSTHDFYSSSNDWPATRPKYSTLDLSKIETTGFAPRDWRDSLREYAFTKLVEMEDEQ